MITDDSENIILYWIDLNRKLGFVLIVISSSIKFYFYMKSNYAGRDLLNAA